jgi:hypothetical protein
MMRGDDHLENMARRAALTGGFSAALGLPLAASGAAFGRRSAVRPDAAGDDTLSLDQALRRYDTLREGSYTVALEEASYRLTGSGRALLTVQTGTRLLGGALEGTCFRVMPSATARAALSDDSPGGGEGSAAKTELYNLTGGGNPRLAAVFDLGTGRSVPFGTYGRIDNLMARDAPNATAFDLSTNIVVVGDLYSMNTRDGLVTADGGSGCNVRSVYPYGFSRYGVRLGGLGDNVLNGEGEAPTSADAVYIYGARSFIVGLGSHLLAVAKGTTLKRPFVIDTQLVGDWVLGPWQFVRNDRSQRYGDFDQPAYSGRATAVGANTLTDIRQDWELDELKGWAIRITSGPGTDNWAEIAGNSRDTLHLVARSWSGTGPVAEAAPSAGSGYAVAPALCRADGGGFASSRVLTLAEAVMRALFARAIRAGSLLVGAANAAVPVTGVLRASATVPRTTLAPGTRSRIAVPGAEVQEGDFVTVSATAWREAGLGVEADAARGQVLLYIENRTTRPLVVPAGEIGLLITQTGQE